MSVEPQKRRGRPPKAKAASPSGRAVKKKQAPESELLANPTALRQTLKQVTKELGELHSTIATLERQQQALVELKQKAQHYQGVQLALNTLLEQLTGKPYKKPGPKPKQAEAVAAPEKKKAAASTANTKKPRGGRRPGRKPPKLEELPTPEGVFIPDLALEQVKAVIKRQGSVNHELYKAVVYAGGRATTEQIKAYLVDNKVTQPNNGRTFEETPLATISSRVNYLIQKKAVKPLGNGAFISLYGWQKGGDNASGTPKAAATDE